VVVVLAVGLDLEEMAVGLFVLVDMVVLGDLELGGIIVDSLLKSDRNV